MTIATHILSVKATLEALEPFLASRPSLADEDGLVFGSGVRFECRSIEDFHRIKRIIGPANWQKSNTGLHHATVGGIRIQLEDCRKLEEVS